MGNKIYINDLVKRLTKIEGKKRQLDAGNAREVLWALKQVCKDADAVQYLLKYLLIQK